MTEYFNIINREISKVPDATNLLNTFYQLKLKHIRERRDTAPNSLIIELFTIPMDLYTLLRMFIRFDVNKMSRGPSGCQNVTTPIFIIFEGGSAHSQFFTEFISSYYNTKPDILFDNPYNSPEYQCIKFSSPFDFFMN